MELVTVVSCHQPWHPHYLSLFLAVAQAVVLPSLRTWPPAWLRRSLTAAIGQWTQGQP